MPKCYLISGKFAERDLYDKGPYESPGHDSFKCVTWLIQMCDMIHSYVWHHSLISVTWLIHMCAMTHSHVWRDSFIYGMTDTYFTWRVQTSHRIGCWFQRKYHNASYESAWHDSFIYVKWLIHLWRDSFRRAIYLVAWLMPKSHITSLEVITKSHITNCMKSHINSCVTHSKEPYNLTGSDEKEQYNWSHEEPYN